MAKKIRKINSSSIGILNTHVEYIREAIDKLDRQFNEHMKWSEKQVEDGQKSFKILDDRIQKLEDWKESRAEMDKRINDLEEKGMRGKHFKLACVGLIISTVLNVIVLILTLAGII